MQPVARRRFLQTIGLPVLFRPGRRVQMTVSSPGRAPARWTLRTADARRKTHELMNSGALGRVVFVSFASEAGPWRLAIHCADATLTLQEAA